MLEKVLLFVSILFTLSGVNAQISNNALHFDGSNFVVVGESPLFDLQANTATTFEGWIRFCDDGMIFSKNWCSGEAGYYMNIVNGGQLRIKGVDLTTCNSGELFMLTTTQTFGYNTWHHFATVITTTSSSTDVKVYMNGTLVLSTLEIGFINNSSEDLILGAYRNIGGSYGLPFNGDIDEFRVYSAALTPAELGLAVPTNPSLVLHFAMEPQSNPLATIEPNLGSLGTGFNGANVLLSTPGTSTVLDYNLTSVYLPTVDLGPDIALNCGVNQVDLMTSNTANSYSWQQSNPTGSSWQAISGANLNTLTYSLGTSTTASVVVTGTSGFCIDTDTINITTTSSTPFFLGNDTTLCTGATLTLDVSSSPGTYLWQDGSTSPVYTVTSGGTYSVEVTENGCMSMGEIVVTYIGAPTFSLGNDTTLCFGESLMIDASANPGPYLWQDGSTGATITANQAGLYWLSISNACGAFMDSLIVGYHPDNSFSLGNDTTICQGETVELVCDVLGATVTWQDGTIGNSYSATISGVYSAQFSLNGCVTSDAIAVNVISAPVVDLGEDFLLCEGDFKVLSADSQNGALLWNTGSSEPSIQVNSAGTYSVEVTNLCGATIDSVVVELEDCYCGLYVPNAFTPNNDEYNGTFGPVSDCILDAYTFEIYNRWGEVIFETQDPFEMWDATYNGKIVQDGIYTYKITYSSQYVIAETITGHVVVIR